MIENRCTLCGIHYALHKVETPPSVGHLFALPFMYIADNALMFTDFQCFI